MSKIVCAAFVTLGCLLQALASAHSSTASSSLNDIPNTRVRPQSSNYALVGGAAEHSCIADSTECLWKSEEQTSAVRERRSWRATASTRATTSWKTLKRLPFVLFAEATPTNTASYTTLHVHDGNSYSVETYPPIPLAGPDYQLHGFSNWGFTKTTSEMFWGGLIADDDLWLTPMTATTELMKVNKLTGVMTKYGVPPGGASFFPFRFVGMVYDGTSLWMIPLSSAQLVQINPATGSMTGYAHSAGDAAFWGGVYDGKGFLWMTPFYANHVKRVDATNAASMTSFTNFPAGSSGADKWGGAAFDGTSMWMPIHTGTRVVGVNTVDTTMRGIDTSSWTGISYSGISENFCSGVYSGQRELYLIPQTADSVVQLNIDTEVAVMHNSWPVGISAAAPMNLLCGVYDGQYLWLNSRHFSVTPSFIRLDTTTGAMLNMGYLVKPAGFSAGAANNFLGLAFDPATKSLWFIPGEANMVLRLTMTTYTRTASETLIPAPLITGTKSETVTPAPAATPSATTTVEGTAAPTSSGSAAPTTTAAATTSVMGTAAPASSGATSTAAAATTTVVGTAAATAGTTAAATAVGATTAGATSTTTAASSSTSSSSGSTGSGGVIAGRAGAARALLAFLLLFLLLLILFLIYWFCIREKPEELATSTRTTEVKGVPSASDGGGSPVEMSAPRHQRNPLDSSQPEMDADTDAEGGDTVSPPEHGIQPVATVENADGVEGGTPTMADPEAFEDVVEDQDSDALTTVVAM